MLSRFEKFIYDISEIDLHWHRLASAEMKRYGLKGNYTVYFTALHSNPDGLTAAQISTLCVRDKADVSRDMSALEKAGFVERVPTGGNGYRAHILLTEQGHRLTEEIIRKAELATRLIGQNLTDAQRDCFYRVLDQITANFQSLSETGLPNKKGE